jgi:hypothetical protein
MVTRYSDAHGQGMVDDQRMLLKLNGILHNFKRSTV